LTIILNLNLAISFLLELFALAALGYWGFTIRKGWGIKIICGLGAPILAAFIWGLYVAPHATYKLPYVIQQAIGLGVFAISIYALYRRGKSTWATIFGVILVVNRLIDYVWEH
jgi:hypothetical protein